MSLSVEGRPLIAAFRRELDALRGNWVWFLVLGIVLIVFGVLGMGYPLAVTLATVTVFGVLLILGGVAEIVGSFWAREWSGVFLHVLSGILSLVVGLLFLGRPLDGSAALTLLLACFLMVDGIFRMISAFSVKFTSWIWPFLGGAIDLLLGIMIWAQWPFSGLWVIGLFVSISLIFRGWAWVMLALSLKSLPRLSEPKP